jgi:hypothetical protein
MGLYGTPELEIVTDDTDQVGLRTLMVALAWAVLRWPMSIPELDEIAPAPPDVGGGLLLVGRRQRHNGGAMNTAWVYTGVNGSGKDVTFKTRGNSIDYRFEPGFSQVDIGLHPRIQQLLDSYQGSAIDGEIYFPPTISKGGKSVKSPVGLMRDFLRMEGTYSYRYVSFSRPSQHHENRIVTGGSLPGTAPAVSSDRNWLVAPTMWQRRGPVFEIVEQYWLSGPGGWPAAVYGRVDQGGSRGLGSSGGLGDNGGFGASDTGRGGYEIPFFNSPGAEDFGFGESTPNADDFGVGGNTGDR